MRSLRHLSFFVCALALAACGADAPPRQLLDARAAYNKARAGKAAQYTPADLHTAKVALNYQGGWRSTLALYLTSVLSRSFCLMGIDFSSGWVRRAARYRVRASSPCR